MVRRTDLHICSSQTSVEVPALPPHETVPKLLLTSPGLFGEDCGGKWRRSRALTVTRGDRHVSGNAVSRAAEKGTTPLAVLLTH